MGFLKHFFLFSMSQYERFTLLKGILMNLDITIHGSKSHICDFIHSIVIYISPGDLGGCLGMCLGASLITIVEIIEFGIDALHGIFYRGGKEALRNKRH